MNMLRHRAHNSYAPAVGCKSGSLKQTCRFKPAEVPKGSSNNAIMMDHNLLLLNVQVW